MKQSQETHKRKDEAVISAKGLQRLRDGHLWIYRSDVIGRPNVDSGSVVRVTDNRGRFVAWAHFGVETEITLRLLSVGAKDDTAIDRSFWQARLMAAAEWRRRVVDDTNA